MSGTTYPIRPDQEWSKGLYKALRLAQLHLAQQHLAELRSDHSLQIIAATGAFDEPSTTPNFARLSDTRDRADARWRRWASQMARCTWQ